MKSDEVVMTINRMEQSYIEGNTLLKAIERKGYVNKHGLHFSVSVFAGVKVCTKLKPGINPAAIICLSLRHQPHEEFFSSYAIYGPDDLDTIDEAKLWTAYTQGKAYLSYDANEISGALVDFSLYTTWKLE